MPSFCDYDNDGDLDCWIVTNGLVRADGRPAQPPVYKDQTTGQMKVKPEFARYYDMVQTGQSTYTMDETGRPDYLLRNDGGKFTDVSDQAGIKAPGFGLSATWWDYNEDGLMDIYVCNDYIGPDQLFKNNGDGTFTDVITETVNEIPWFSMGSDAGDINNDGRLDFIALDMAPTTHYKSKMAMGEMGSSRWAVENVKPRQLMRNVCFLNTATARFIETAQLSGIASTDWSWAAKLADFDNDGRVDLFVSNGMTRDFNNSDFDFDKSHLIGKTQWDHFENTPTMPEQNLAFKNVDGLKFKDVSRDWGVAHTGMSYGTAYGDIDRDGDLDLVVVNLDEPVSIYRNNSVGSNTIAVQLKGRESNSYGIGALVRLEAESGTLHVRQMMPATGFLSSNLPELHFGLGNEARVKKLTVTWPSGRVQAFENLSAENRFVIQEPAGSVAQIPAKPTPLFAESKVLDGLFHREENYEDFDRQPLLPNKLSQLGPGLAWADVDGDGDEDLFIGAARNMGGAVLLNEGPDADGVCQFSLPSPKPFIDDAAQENMCALFFDADADGDMDLYVANGSYEFNEGDVLLRDSLYVNDGTGRFTKAIGALPDFRDSSSCVVGADFDRDGDVDLFVGGRVIPGKYPETPKSRLLINESAAGRGPKLVEAADAIARGLQAAGLVTGAQWSDADNDGWVDLFVTCEWGPVRYFHNRNGILEDRTDQAGLSKLLGWWNAIAGADIDRDGDIDYAVANFGLNTKYHASTEKPSLLFYGDYAGDGKKSLVEAKYENNVLLPVRGKSCSTSAMPHLAKRFDSFHKFASAALPEIYSPAALEHSLKLSANTLESGILLNNGNGQFQFKPLPLLAQVSPGFGLCFLDADADGNTDLFMAQNFFGPQFETGPFAGGLSLLLLGDGTGGFLPLSPDRSGIVIPGDATAATAMDFNGDGRLDLAVAQNNGPVRTFESTATGSGRFIRICLDGGPGNPSAVGARVTVLLESGDRMVQEVYAGAGYLSQAQSCPVFTLANKDKVTRIFVRWPDGKSSQKELPDDVQGTIRIMIQ
ncbi:MAG: FG-GAP-like repeat-containing protein [Verrucomicrobia bacterium]|nr:FG-GAP-like repeat-containing protein [Verrucomicrobiota bacterium]